MTRAVPYGSLHFCSFPDNGMTPVSGPQLVVVLNPLYSPETGQCLVAGAFMQDGKAGVDLHHLHTVRIDSLQDSRLHLEPELFHQAHRALAEKVGSGS
ncbi:hypothetical protein [Amycolatopsis sp. NPDC098790]|uniref:hypothetical protein n=1 Tax=Amycolatopsis sp. NPDC098790 TaxID=3363939 RepID=UPI0037F792FA